MVEIKNPGLIDVHTHHPGNPRAVRNIFPGEVDRIKSGYMYSVGLHPWHVKNEKDDTWFKVLKTAAGKEEVVAIGEAGLDKLTDVSMDEQMTVFEQHAEIAEKAGKPLIVHCVRAWQELIALKNRRRSAVKWIVHGYNSKPAVVKMLLDNGFVLSFGKAILDADSNASAVLKQIDYPHFFLETDDSNHGIEVIYKAAAQIRNCSVEDLSVQIKDNFYNTFGRLI
ncbi:MAG: TatD family hydrolase [Bacteroidales bacterium]